MTSRSMGKAVMPTPPDLVRPDAHGHLKTNIDNVDGEKVERVEDGVKAAEGTAKRAEDLGEEVRKSEARSTMEEEETRRAAVNNA